MAEKPKSDRTSVTISKELHQEFKVACARLAITQRSTLERLISQWLQQWRGRWPEDIKKED